MTGNIYPHLKGNVIHKKRPSEKWVIGGAKPRTSSPQTGYLTSAWTRVVEPQLSKVRAKNKILKELRDDLSEWGWSGSN